MTPKCATVPLPLLTAASEAYAKAQQEKPPYTRIRDVIYGRRDGFALTMDILQPAQPSGIGVLWMVSGGWWSTPEFIDVNQNPAGLQEYLNRGQTLFAVVHGCQPRCTIPEIREDISRAVRFVRTHASEYGVDPNRLGISGGSSGGHLSLITAARGADGDPEASDPVERASSRVQAVACLFPPTDFLNYGSTGTNMLTVKEMEQFWPALGAKSDDPAERAAVAKATSPITYFTGEMPPTLIIHGDVDPLVPLQQAQTAIQRLRELGVPHQLIVREGNGHGWPDIAADWGVLADWFDQHLAGK